MKQINLKDAEVVEVVLRPLDELPLTVQYRIKDDAGNVIMYKTTQVTNADMPAAAKNALTALIGKITERLVTLEEL